MATDQELRCTMKLIPAFNSRQIALAIWNFCLSAVSFAICYGFFYFAAYWLISQFRVSSLAGREPLFAVGLVILTAFLGWLRAREDKGLYGFHESGVFLNADPTTGVGYLAQRDIQRVTGPAYVLSQIFLAGSLQLLRGLTRLRDLLPPSEELEASLVATLAEIRRRNKWEGSEDYPQQVREVFLLNRMKMKFRAKSNA
jgi:hypothetical protein